jgi:hypothetical protein
MDVSKRRGTINARFATAQHVQVRPIENENLVGIVGHGTEVFSTL